MAIPGDTKTADGDLAHSQVFHNLARLQPIAKVPIADLPSTAVTPTINGAAAASSFGAGVLIARRDQSKIGNLSLTPVAMICLVVVPLPS